MATSFRKGDEARIAPKTRFSSTSVAELLALPDRAQVIDGMIPLASDVLLAGPSGHGKTLAAVSMAIGIAGRTAHWHGHAVEGGPVAYILAEGQSGGRDRVAAALHATGLSAPEDLRFYLDAPQLLDLGDTAQLLTAIRADFPVPPVAIFIDTYAACAAGSDESTVRDTSLVLGSIALLRRELGCAIVLIHHSGWEGKRERGSSALRGAMDVVLFLEAEDDIITLKSLKVRDGAPLTPLTFRIQPVLESAVLVPADASVTPTELHGSERDALRALDKVATTDGVTASVWLASSSQPQSSFYRHRKMLLVKGLIRLVRGSRYALSAEGYAELSLPSNSHFAPMGPGDSTPTHSPPLRGGSVGVPETNGRKQVSRT